MAGNSKNSRTSTSTSSGPKGPCNQCGEKEGTFKPVMKVNEKGKSSMVQRCTKCFEKSILK